MGKVTSKQAAHTRRTALGLAFVLPALVLFVTFLIGPLLWIVLASFFEWTSTVRGAFTGIGNYVALFSRAPFSTDVPRAFMHNVSYFVGVVILQNVVGLFLAVQLQRLTKARRLFQVIFVTPYLISPLVIGYLWIMLLSPYFGPVVALLEELGLGALAHPWLGDPRTAFPTVIIIGAWQWIGFPVLLYGAALAGIPREYDEAAVMDGASGWRRFWSVTLPILSPVIGTVTILTFIASMEVFPLIYAIGGPTGTPAGSTDVLGLVFYRTSFQAGASNALGHSSALGVLLLLLVLGGALGAQRVFRKLEERLS